jgi:hypothetical protein
MYFSKINLTQHFYILDSCGLGAKPEFEAKKTDEPLYFQQNQWYYVENLNLCKEVPGSSKEKIPTFDSKRICEETCKIAPCIYFYY